MKLIKREQYMSRQASNKGARSSNQNSIHITTFSSEDIKLTDMIFTLVQFPKLA